MKIDLTQRFSTLTGESIDNADGAPVTLEEVIIQALTVNLEKDKNQQGKEKFELYQLGQKISGQKEVDLETGDITIIKERIGLAYNVLIVGQAWNMLEGK